MFQRLDIVESAPGWSRAVFVITDVDLSRPKNIYTGVDLRTRRCYRLSDEGLAPVRVGQVDESWFQRNLGTAAAPAEEGDQEEEAAAVVNPEMVRRGQFRARREALFAAQVGATEPQARWEKLAALQPGDMLTILRRGQPEQVRFHYVTERGTRYVFVASNQNGTTYRYPLAVVQV
jgi:hypothetical protein